jgi:arginine utilization protein RocB
MTSWPSVTGTAGEADFATKLAAMLTSLGLQEVWTEAIPGDGAGRSTVFALKRGRSSRAIVLTGHFDVVPVADYGDLMPLAFAPEELLPAIVARLRASGAYPQALADFESGDYLPGRGLLDMKAGLAAGLAALLAHEGEASLLFMAVADEEERSAGARAAVPRLSAICEERGIGISLVINLDAISDQGDGSKGRVVALGSIGKQLLTAFVAGKETHACYPEDGANAAYLAAELVSTFELAPELAEDTGEERAAPPTALHAKDLKSGYNVTTPAEAFIYWNTLQHRRGPQEVLAAGLELARRAMARAEARLGRPVPVITYAELKARVKPETLARKASELAGQEALDLPERAKQMTAFAMAQSGLTGPLVVMGFGSIPYPAVTLGDRRLEQVIMAAAGRHGLKAIRYFPGISDVSYYGEAAGLLDVAAANTPIWGTSFVMPEAGNYPAINIGPWGRDYHHWLERLHAPYAFEVLPEVLLSVIEAVGKAS